MRRLGFILLTGICLLVFVVPIRSQEIPDFITDSLTMDSIAIDSLDPDPEWYVEPEVRADYIRAPRRTSASTCPKDSVLIFNIDSVLVEVTVYEYSGDTTRTMVWTVNTDGSRFGTSKTEEASTSTASFNATYAWDNTTNDWKGTSKTEHIYANNKETTRILYNTWLNNAWVADTKYTWIYDAAGRETEYTTYTRNTSTNELVLSQQRIREWYNNSKLTLEIQYTAHNGTEWSAGTKKEYDYDAAGNQIEYTYYSSLSNGNWIGSTHEVWTYTSGKKTYYEKQTWSNGWVNNTKEIWEFNGPSAKQTLHEKYNGSNTDWTLALQENLGYDEAGNNTLVENYSLTNNVWKGTKKEEYTYVGTNKTGTITCNWNADNNAFVYKTWSINNTAENPNEKCSYNWVNDAWVGTGTRKLTTKTGGKTTEVITQTWPSGSIVWVNKTCTTTIYVGDNKTQETCYDWSNDTWVGTKRTDYTFNADGINIMTHNAKWQNNAWVMTSMTRTDISDETIDGVHQISYTQWQCGADSVWKGVQKDTTSYYITAESTQNPLYSASFSSMVNNDWVPSYKIEHEYDEADREILNRRMDWVNNKWQGHYLYEYEYNDFGQQTSYTYYGDWNSNTNTWKGSSKYDYVYAPNGQYAQQVMYRWQNNQWVGLFQYFYTYDAANHEIEQLVQGYSDGNWQNSQLYIHEYRGSEVIKNNEYRWRNEQWQFTRRNEKIYDNDAQAKLRREITGSWNTNGVLISYTDKHYVYPCDPRTIRFVNYDGTLLETQTLDKGVTPSYSGAEPTRESNAEYTYAFSGWAPAIVPVNGNATYTATFTATKNTYTITWKNEDGTQIDQTTAEYGTMPTHEDASKANTAEFSYEFTGWTPGLGIVTGDATYTASFTATKNKYTIIFLNYDGSELQSSEVEYGVTPNYEGATPIKPADAQDTYTFAGWDQEIIPVAGTKTYTATFTGTKNSYTITWLNDDNTLIDQTTVEYGAMPQHEAATKENTAEWTYTFTGWSPAIVSVTGDATYQATFTQTKNSYTITWLNEDGSEISHETLEYGATPSHVDSTKEATDEFTYTFAGWNPAVTSVTGDASYTATYTATKRSYTITWLDDDNTQIDQTSIEYGVVPTHDDPAKQATAEFTYTFTGWDNTPIAVVGEATYKATYSAAKNSYTITWLNDDDTQIDQTTVEYGVVPTHEDPTKQPTAQYGYTFTGWSPAITSVTGNATYKAMYTDTINQYTISWLDDTGTLVDQTKVAYGSMPAHANIYKESDDQYDYTFVGWTPTLVPVTGDASYSAIFTTAGKSYTVTFYFEDGVTILDQMTLPYGAIPSTSYIPSIPSDANHTYTFSGWSPEIAPVTGDISYVPTFTAIPNQYTVIFRNYNGKELQRKKVDYGTIPEYEGDEPSRPATNAYTWAFEGWTPELTAVIGDATYTAVYTKVMNTYTILFYDEDGTTLLDEVTVEHGQKPTTSVIPTKEADEEYRYTFAGWSPKIAKATSDAEYTATYLATPKTQDLNNTEAEGAAIKVIIEDKIYIRRGGNTYSIDGQRVK